MVNEHDDFDRMIYKEGIGYLPYQRKGGVGWSIWKAG
jgi:hypothetical protein